MLLFELIGNFFIEAVRSLGKIGYFIFLTFKYLFFPRFYLNFNYFIKILLSSIPIVTLTAIFSGMVLALQSYTGFSRFSAETAIPKIVVLTLTRELGPVLAGLMVAGRVGASIAAEIATMRVTEQIDALKTLNTNFYNYLVTPWCY
jgi:phospholipid/cholesterol/gamma-HCH transport system permease protein